MRAPKPASGIPPEHLAALSHEFRTPLNGVIGMARLLDSTRLTAEQSAYVGALMESAEHLLGLVGDVLDYARLGAGRIDLTLAPVSPEDLLRSVCELLSPKAHEKGLEIGWAAAADLAPILADEGRLKQILLNLAGNAVKFTETGGVLALAEWVDHGRLRFTISDTGPGVAADQRETIFEAFIQGAPGQIALHGGAGLGLAIAARLAEVMDGALGVGGEPGQGADFWFEAPFDAASAAAEAGSSLEGRVAAVVSPSPIVREAAARQIEASGGRAMRAETLPDAVAMTDSGDVLLVDHLLADGASVMSPPKDRASVVLLRPGERDRIAPYRAAGYGGYLIKPLRRASLVERVRAAGQSPDDDRIAPRRSKAAPAGGGVRVLLAEDNPINAMLARTLLRREGADVEHAADGAAVLEALTHGAFDLVLMDVRMPGLSGIEATRALRARGVTTPVVALTANAFDDDRRACLEAGMDDFLVKPLNPEALRALLSRLAGPGWTERRPRAKVAS